MTVEQALTHPWLMQESGNLDTAQFFDRRRDERIFKRIKDLKCLKKLQQDLLLILVQIVDEHQFDENRRTFHTIDIDHSGAIDKQELKKALSMLVDE